MCLPQLRHTKPAFSSCFARSVSNHAKNALVGNGFGLLLPGSGPRLTQGVVDSPRFSRKLDYFRFRLHRSVNFISESGPRPALSLVPATVTRHSAVAPHVPSIDVHLDSLALASSPIKGSGECSDGAVRYDFLVYQAGKCSSEKMIAGGEGPTTRCARAVAVSAMRYGPLPAAAGWPDRFRARTDRSCRSRYRFSASSASPPAAPQP
jgi:hypothetical protein